MDLRFFRRRSFRDNDLLKRPIKILWIIGRLDLQRHINKALSALGTSELGQALRGRFFCHASQCSVIKRQFKLARISLTPWPSPRSRTLRWPLATSRFVGQPLAFDALQGEIGRATSSMPSRARLL